ncbi:MAG: hypothetical protein EOO38_20170 [Cytophagaceae bacterium]|nr:MAG: hypothetical protein EOO38_20170 [Cytophagaceae bacterium]
MNVSVIGTGNIGDALGTLFSKAGHNVVFGSRQPDGADKVSIEDALEQGEVVVLAVPYATALELAEQEATQKALQGKIVIDVTNPLAPDYMSLTVGHTTSAGEEIAKRLTGARIVKAFNTIFADVLKAKVEGETVPFEVFVAGDDAEARATVAKLAKSIGFSAVDSGAISNAKYLEAVIALTIQLAYVQGRGTRIGFKLAELAAK